MVAIAAAYYAFAVGGKALLLTGPAGAFWPAAGLAVAVLYLGGLRWWPGILLGDLGSLLGDVLSDELAVPVGTALAQAVGDITGLLGRRSSCGGWPGRGPRWIASSTSAPCSSPSRPGRRSAPRSRCCPSVPAAASPHPR